jgi:phage-related protein (TIGR01555 family)
MLGESPMLQKIISQLFAKKFVADSEFPKEEAKAVDPLDPIARRGVEWPEAYRPELKSVSDFAVFDGLAGEGVATGDAALKTGAKIGDDSEYNDGPGFALKGGGNLGVPSELNAWYMSQSFIGYQACAIIAQHWLVDKACSMSGEDAARNGWVIAAQGGDKDTEDLDKPSHDAIMAADKEFKIKENIVEFNRFKNIFGIRVAIFKVKSSDPLYYEKPFNIDGVAAGSYEGISQIDPYWMTPVLTTVTMSDPSDIGFYEPQYWQINGLKYHISHLAIARGPHPSDILKPTYIFGGIPLVQRIYERVYAAERTANESPLMAMSKRTMAIHADMDKIMMNQDAFEQRLAMWIRYRDNHGIKVLGTEEAMEQFDTSMTDFDSIIMNQYQIVAAIARTPATKLLGTSPKGFNSTGEFESKSYHEELESVQEHVMMPMLERHYQILSRSLGLNVELTVVCNPVDSVTTQERADLNKLKSDTGVALINAGVISPDEERARLIDDEHSGYDRLEDSISAHEQPGMSPENIAALQKSGAAQTTAENPAGGMPPGAPGAAPEDAGGSGQGATAALLSLLMGGAASGGKPLDQNTLNALMALLAKGSPPAQAETADAPGMASVQPSTEGSVSRSVNIEDRGEVVRAMPQHRMPKLRWNGLNLFIENPRGTVRVGQDITGKEWAQEMPDHYGFIKGYIGADEQDVDCFIGSNLRSDEIYVIVQKCPETDEFDEYKCMIGYDSPEEACAVYHQAYTDNWKGFDHMLPPMSVEEFKSWLEGGGGGQSVPLMSMDEFKESEHPRGQPGNAGEFGPGGGSAAAKAKSTTPKVKATVTKAPKPIKSEGVSVLVPVPREQWPAHIKKLAIPPAWTDVKINPNPKGMMLAMGNDSKGRPQYRYSEAFKSTNKAAKFGRVQAMNSRMPTMATRIENDAKSTDAKTKDNADSMTLVVGMGLRPGSDNDTKAEKKAFGASNLEGRHVVIHEDGSVNLDFTGKKGVDLNFLVNDADLVAMLKERKAAQGDGRLFPNATDRSLLAYSKALSNGKFKTKDFRTYKGTATAIDEIKKMPVPKTMAEFKHAVKEVGVRVSKVLGNTPTVALQSYIEPSVFSAWKANLS